MFKSKMTTPATPERVYALCKLVESGPAAARDLQERMEPSCLGQTTKYFGDYRGAAEELGLITVADNTVSLAVDRAVVRSTDTMRKYINGKLHEFREGTFCRVTRAVFALDWKTLRAKCTEPGKDPSVTSSELLRYVSDLSGAEVDAMAMRGWRFWVSYLGFGYMQGMFFIPNAYGFLSDVLPLAELKKGERTVFDGFMERILPYCPMLVTEDDRASRALNYGMSAGLRMLHDTGSVKLEHIMDQKDPWRLYGMRNHPVSADVSHITALK